ncbi:MAG: type II toxin-antitoxin system ParD family antitoxin [Chromatiales bacterium]|nr:type II toxin-antitoxin system ParD family antitoxin [Chromatiales bacterium]
MPRNTSVTLGEHFDAFVGRKIAEGRYQSVSEAVRAGLRRLEEDEAKLEALRAKLLAGQNSPLVEDFDPQRFLAEMREKSGKTE